MKLRHLLAAAAVCVLSACSDSASLPTSSPAASKATSIKFVPVPDGNGGGEVMNSGGGGDLPPPIQCDTDAGFSPVWNGQLQKWECRDAGGHLGGGG